MIPRKITQYIFFFFIAASFIAVIACALHTEAKSSKIAIFHSFSHSLLEECAQNCIESLETRDPPLEILIVNAEENTLKAKKLARTLHNDPNILAIITLGSMATKIMSQIETQKPIVYAAVPERETLSFPKGQTNLYGVNDTLDINRCCFAIQVVRANAESLLYLKSAESFPSSVQKEMTKKLQASGITVTELAITSNNFKTRIRQALTKRPSAIFLPLSSLSHKQRACILEDIIKENIPVITDDLSLISEGACAGCNVDFKESGKQAAQIVNHLLNHAQDTEGLRRIIAEPLPQTTTFNEDAIHRLGIQPERKQLQSILFKEKQVAAPSPPL